MLAFILSLFHVALYQPLFNIFVWVYNVVPGHDVGFVIIIITVLIRLAVYPLTSTSLKSQKAMQGLQPKMDALKKQYANDQQKQAQALMELYKTNKVNPFASCLPLLIQLPILIALYAVMRDGLILEDVGKDLYSFISNPGHLNPVSLGFIDMGKANIVLAVLAGLAQFWQTKSLIRTQPPKEAGAGGKDESMMAIMNKQMLYMMPIMTVVIGATLPAGLTLYWLFSTLLMGVQQMILFKKNGKNDIIPPSENKVIEGEIISK